MTQPIVAIRIDIYEYYGEGELSSTEYDVCSYFGCGNRLTIQEKLFGSRCVEHTECNNQKRFTMKVEDTIASIVNERNAARKELVRFEKMAQEAINKLSDANNKLSECHELLSWLQYRVSPETAARIKELLKNQNS